MRKYIKRLTSGRLGIKRYYLGNLLIVVFFFVPTAILLLSNHFVIGTILAIITYFYLCTLSIRRMHDCGQYASWGVWLGYCGAGYFERGDKNENEYGKASDNSTSFLKDIFNPSQ